MDKEENLLEGWSGSAWRRFLLLSGVVARVGREYEVNGLLLSVKAGYALR